MSPRLLSHESLLGSRQARAARVLCAITFHFVASRLGFLAEVLRALAEYQVAAIDIVIVTNTSRPDELGLLRRLGDEILSGNGFTVSTYGNLSNPQHLTWCHKEIIAREFAHGGTRRYTHFIYLEDDIRLSFVNFCYFIEYREVLLGLGLLPAFVRMEFSASLGGMVASDAFWPVYVPVQSHVLLEEFVFVNMPNPYNPCFILDAALAEEYVHSPAFDREGSLAVCRWGVQERAAMGLCLENVPAPFQSRYVVPVSRLGRSVPIFARISHLPNNYANDPRSPLAKVRLDSLFMGVHELGSDGRWRADDAAIYRTGRRACDAAGKPARGPDDPGQVASAVGVDAVASEDEDAESKDQYYLVTHHDTLVFVDEHLKLLRHAPFGIAPLNLVIELDNRRGRFVVKRQQLPVATSPGQVIAQLGRGNADCEVEAFADGSIGVRAGERYLSADMDGVVRNNRGVCLDWERYRLVRVDTLDGLTLLRRYQWLSPGDRRILALAAQPLDFGREHPTEASALAATLAAGSIELRREFVFGPSRIRVAGKQPAFLSGAAAGNQDDAPSAVKIAGASGTAHEFLRFDPLVHYDVDGDDSAYDRLYLSLSSLAKHARFQGTVGVACDRPVDELVKYIPDAFRDRLVVFHPVEKQDALDRHRLVHCAYRAHQPVLCCNVDTIFDADITDLLIDLLVGDRGKRQELAGRGSVEVPAEHCRPSTACSDLVPTQRRGLVDFRPTSDEESGCTIVRMRSYLADLDARRPDEGAVRQAVSIPSIAGLLDAKELEQVGLLARQAMPNGCIVEVGSALGQVSRSLAANASAGATVYCLESWGPEGAQAPSLERFEKNTSGLQNILSLPGHSPRDFLGWQRAIDLLYIGHLHSKPALRQNLAFWAHLVRPRGCICGHGYSVELPEVVAEVGRLAAAVDAIVETTGAIWSITVPDQRPS